VINFIPNDPDESVLPIRQIQARPNRPANRAGFKFFDQQPEAVYNPITETAGFLFWQCREAALAALEGWEKVSGASFAAWQGDKKKLDLRQDDGVDLNAFYDRQSLSFFHFPSEAPEFLSGASTDVVAHEAGHGILDAIRPEFFNLMLFEINAFHEAFGDVVAILTALFDGPSLASVRTSIQRQNFVESTAENLAAGIKSIQADHNAAAPRRARNNFKWKLPSSLPDFGSPGDGPGKLINEIHSFGQIFSGCFWDTIVNIFNANGQATDAALLKSVRTAGELLATAVAVAPANTRFFREVGRAMVKADEQANGAANRNAIKAAFEAHDIPLGTGAMLAPVAGLGGRRATVKAAAGKLAAGIKKDLLSRIGAPGGKLITAPVRIGAQTVVQAIHERFIRLDHVHKKLKGVVARATDVALVGESGGRAAILGALPVPESTADEVETFVRSLVAQDAIDFYGKQKTKAKKALMVARKRAPPNPITHTVKTVAGKRVLTRLRFACVCNC
jgi:hypothetical protein